MEISIKVRRREGIEMGELKVLLCLHIECAWGGGGGGGGRGGGGRGKGVLGLGR